MKSVVLVVLMFAFIASAAPSVHASIPNNERVLSSGKRVATLPGYLYRVTYKYYQMLPDGQADLGNPQSDYFLFAGSQETAYNKAGNAANAMYFFMGEGFQYAIEPDYFDKYFAYYKPDRWDQ